MGHLGDHSAEGGRQHVACAADFGIEFRAGRCFGSQVRGEYQGFEHAIGVGLDVVEACGGCGSLADPHHLARGGIDHGPSAACTGGLVANLECRAAGGLGRRSRGGRLCRLRPWSVRGRGCRGVGLVSDGCREERGSRANAVDVLAGRSVLDVDDAPRADGEACSNGLLERLLAARSAAAPPQRVVGAGERLGLRGLDYLEGLLSRRCIRARRGRRGSICCKGRTV